MGRRKKQNAKSEVIRISPMVRRELQIVKTDYRMPQRYTENEIIEAILGILPQKENITGVISVT
jgi:hypothetical protein